jgi:hypothetical protein
MYGAFAGGRRTMIERCFAAVQGRGSVGHLGVMPGRDKQPVRLNIKDLRCGALLPLLHDIGWQGSYTAAGDVFGRLLDEADLVSVALDLFDDWLPVIGFEAFMKTREWQVLLGRLCREGLCTPDECRSLLEFPATFTPGPSGPQWPASWLVAAALAPPDTVPLFRRELSHIKITLDAAGKPSAKAYLGMYHEWRVPQTHAPPPVVPAARLLEARVADSVAAAHDFLMAGVSQGGFWRDFHLDIGSSDEWVTAFIASQMTLTGLPLGLTAAREALCWLLRRQRPCGGWGYNAIAPADADSTAWVLRLAMACGFDTEAIRRARAFLAGHGLPDGHVTTYSSSTPIRFGDRNLSDREAAGWRGAHHCVTANAAPLLGAAAMEALRRSQTASGAWRAHWWQSDMFATALAAESLAGTPHPGNGDCIARAARWAAARDAVAGAPAFDIAWSLRLARLARSGAANPAVALRVNRLLDLQQADGGWPAGAPMLFPHPSEIERTAGAPLFIDRQRNFTTAAVHAALAMAAPELARKRLVKHETSSTHRAQAALQRVE